MDMAQLSGKQTGVAPVAINMHTALSWLCLQMSTSP